MRRFSFLFLLILLGLIIVSGQQISARVDRSNTSAQKFSSPKPVVGYAEHVDLSMPFRLAPSDGEQEDFASDRSRKGTGSRLRDRVPAAQFPNFAPPATPKRFSAAIETIYRDRSWAAVHWIPDVNPPNTNGAAGPNHYVQATTHSYGVYDKRGAILKTSTRTFRLWSGSAAPCSSNLNGDPIVLHDQFADRWVFSQYAAPNYPSGPFYQCIAVSQTPDPLGSYYRYQFKMSDTLFNASPKLAIWPDGYYMAADQFSGTTFNSAAAVVFERSKMLLGQSARFVKFTLTGERGLLPSDIDGSTLPPSGAPNYYADIHAGQVHISKFRVNWTTTSSSSFQSAANLTVNPFDSTFSCGSSGRDCIPQRNTTEKIDVVAGRLMYRAAYRNRGTHESLVLNHTIDVGTNRAGIRWYEVRNLFSTPTLFQQGSFSPDSSNRWLGSIAMDKQGNIMLGYNIANSSIYPSMGMVGRNSTDAKGALSNERVIFPGIGSYTHPSGLWGAFSSIAVDPKDDCSFYYTNEYCCWKEDPTAWRTRVVLVRFPSCLKGTPTGQTVIPFASTWKYLDDGTNQGTAWIAAGFNDAAWKSGNGQFGYGDGDEATFLNFGPDSTNKFITYYFRRTFNIADKSALSGLTLSLRRDDGGVVYINGVEVVRDNMPTGTITYTTRAATSSDATVQHSLGTSALVNGTNVIAVEIHQSTPSSIDLTFDMQLLSSSS